MSEDLLAKKRWKVLFKVISNTHNRLVKRHFKPNTNEQISKGRAFLTSTLAIAKNDSGIICLVKMVFFRLYLSRINSDAVAATAEFWDLIPGNDVPQLAIIFRNTDKKSKSGDYCLHIPHYNGSKNPTIPSYTRGNYWTRLILKDNSRIICYANSEREADRQVNALAKYVDPKYKTRKPTKGRLQDNTFAENKAIPVRADYYEKGKNGGVTWRHYF